MRSRDSWTAASGKRTMVKPACPLETSTSTSTSAPSSPTMAQLATLASTSLLEKSSSFAHFILTPEIDYIKCRPAIARQ